ncbi:MAG TPA: hypothetical protein VD791_00425 [Burkholderiales bacterium]|nr:hypothetical protein [Burkholderiales bacterium]
MAPDSPPLSSSPAQAAHGRRLRFTAVQTLVAMGLLSAFPGVVLALLLLGAQQRDIEAVDKRVRGQEYGAAVSRLLSAVHWHRDLSSRALLGDTSVEGTLRRAQTELRSALRELDAAAAQEGFAFALIDRWGELRAQWARVESEQPTLTPAANVEAHNRLLAEAGVFLALVGQRSELLLDPAPGVHALSVCSTLTMPALARHTGMLRAYALLTAREVSPAQRERIVRTLADARTAFDQVVFSLDEAYAADGKTRAALQERTTRALEQVRRVLDQAETAFAPGRRPDLDANAWFSATTQAVEALEGARDAAAARVSSLLSKRARGLRERRLVTQALAVLVIAGTLLGVLVLGRSLLRGRAPPLTPPLLMAGRTP